MSNDNKHLKRIPNIITFARTVAVPVVVWLLIMEDLHPNKHYSHWAALLFFAAAMSDWADGALARRWNVISKFGKLMDPLADKLIVLAALIMLVQLEWIAGWVAVVILSRELMINFLRTIAATEGFVLASDNTGKLKTVFQFAGITWIMVRVPILGFDVAYIGAGFIYISVVLSVVSAIQYFISYFRHEAAS